MSKRTTFGCVICDEELGKAPENSKDESLKSTPCGHVFHSDCLQQWMTSEWNGLSNDSGIIRDNFESAQAQSKIEILEKELEDSKELCQFYVTVNENLNMELEKEKSLSEDYLTKYKSCQSFVDEKNKECKELEEKLDKLKNNTDKENTELKVENQRLMTKLSKIRKLAEDEQEDPTVINILDNTSSLKAAKPTRKRRRGRL